MHLLLNAIQAVAEETGSPHEIAIEVHADAAAVTLMVSDTGPGIPDDVLPRVFDPFFSTKGSSQAAGIGLTVARAAVEKLGGSIELTRADGRGTRATVTVPLES